MSWLDDIDQDDTPQVGGKNSSLGEMISALRERGIRVPGGFATTANAYRLFIEENQLQDRIRELLDGIEGPSDLSAAGKKVRTLISKSELPDEIAEAIRAAYGQLCQRSGRDDLEVAVRSSATAEDLPEASFAGQQESFLNISGSEELLKACIRCYASLFTDRAIAYRQQKGFDHLEVALSVGVQEMVRADQAGAGVAFTLDTDTGFPDMVLINAAWGLGENVVQGTIEPDQYRVFKPFIGQEGKTPVVQKVCGAKELERVYAKKGETEDREVEPQRRDQLVLSDDEIVQLARWCVAIEEHYGRPMDIEWAKDGRDDQLYVVQARPETVQSQQARGALATYAMKESGETLTTGLAIGRAIATGKVFVIAGPDDGDRFEEGGVLVTEMTDPDWVPLMRRAAAVVTDHGGRTSHAAIVSRELGVPAIVGTEDATTLLEDGEVVTVDCAEGDRGIVYDGQLAYERNEVDPAELPEVKTKIMMNIASPTAALGWWRLPVDGIGLARMEYLINNVIEIHPMALVCFDELGDEAARERIEHLTRRYDDKCEYFVDELAHGIAVMAASQYPKPVILRMSDFKTNEYADLVGGSAFEPHEENPMLGWRGASRYYDPDYRAGFALECRAVRRVREELGFDNVIVMIPFCRTPAEADRVLSVMAEEGLVRGEGGLQIYVMAEIPSNIIEAEAFAERFDGFSIGSNDLTQLVLGVGRDADKLGELFDEDNPSVRWMIAELARRARAAGKPVGLCGQAPSDKPEFAGFLVEAGLTSISVNPDSIEQVMRHVAEAEGNG